MGRLGFNDAVTRRIFKLRRTTKLDSQRIRAKTVKQLEELFDIAAAIARGQVKSQRVDGKEVLISLKVRQMWARVAANIAQTMSNMLKGFDERQLDEGLATLEKLIDEIKAEIEAQAAAGTGIPNSRSQEDRESPE
jgi:hypothetical protein